MSFSGLSKMLSCSFINWRHTSLPKHYQTIKGFYIIFLMVKLTTVSRAPCRKLGWNCINRGSVPGSPWTKPLGGEWMNSQSVQVRHPNLTQTKQSTNQGKSSKMGLALVLKTAMTAGRFAACGSPEAKEENQISHLKLKYWSAPGSQKRKEWPLRSTASRSPLGSQDTDWISPPTLTHKQDREG